MKKKTKDTLSMTKTELKR